VTESSGRSGVKRQPLTSDEFAVLIPTASHLVCEADKQHCYQHLLHNYR